MEQEGPKPSAEFVLGFTIIFAVFHCMATWFLILQSVRIEEDGPSGVFDYLALALTFIIFAPFYITGKVLDLLSKIGLDWLSSPISKWTGRYFVGLSIATSLALGFGLSYLLPFLWSRFRRHRHKA